MRDNKCQSIVCNAIVGVSLPQQESYIILHTPTIPGNAATLPICFTAGKNPPTPIIIINYKHYLKAQTSASTVMM